MKVRGRNEKGKPLHRGETQGGFCLIGGKLNGFKCSGCRISGFEVKGVS